LDVVEELRETYDFSKLKVLATLLDAPLVSESFTLDFDFEVEQFITIPRREPYRRRRKRKASAPAMPIEESDPTTREAQPLIVKRVVQKVGDNKELSILVLGGYIGQGALNNGISGAIGEALLGTVTLVVALRDKT